MDTHICVMFGFETPLVRPQKEFFQPVENSPLLSDKLLARAIRRGLSELFGFPDLRFTTGTNKKQLTHVQVLHCTDLKMLNPVWQKSEAISK